MKLAAFDYASPSPAEEGGHDGVAPLPTLWFPNYALRAPAAAGKITRSSVRQ